MKKIILYTLLAIAAVTAIFLVFFTPAPPQVQVSVVQVQKGSIVNTVTATGTVEPITQVSVGTQVSGVIEKIYVDYNSEVKANQLLAELDKSTLRASLAEARANLKSALNDQQYQQANFDRVAQLYENHVVSKTDYEEALYTLNAAKITAEQRQSDVDRAVTNLSYASIYSPIDGVVLSRGVDEGQTVAASYSTPELFTIARDLKQMQVEADVDEADIGQVRVGQRVVFTVDAYPGDEFSGEVTQVRLEPTEESNVITYTVIIKAGNEEGKLMPGLTASIAIYTEELKDVLTLEAKAFSFEMDEAVEKLYRQQFEEKTVKVEDQSVDQVSTAASEVKKVWVMEGDDLLARAVTTGSSDGIRFQVLNGLQENDEVVYAMEVAKTGADEAPTTSSPFMPKPPGAK